jgi:hypothetical protein
MSPISFLFKGFNSTGNPFSVWNALNGRTVPMTSTSTDVEGSPTQQQQPFFSFRPNDIPVPQLDDTDELDEEVGPSKGRPIASKNDGPLFLSSDIDQLAEQPAEGRVRSQVSGSGDNKRKRDESGSQSRPTRIKSEPKARKIEFEGRPYEVVRSDNPKGPHTLIVNCSDGDVRKWPEHTDRTDQREASEANYYEGVGPESGGKGPFTTWAETLGKAVAGMLNIKQCEHYVSLSLDLSLVGTQAEDVSDSTFDSGRRKVGPGGFPTRISSVHTPIRAKRQEEVGQVSFR